MCSATSLVRVFGLAAVFGVASSVPVQQPQQRENVVVGGLGTVLWSVLDDCFGGGGGGGNTAVVCLKSKALTALDRALSKPTVVVVEGLVLSARAGKSLSVDPQAEKADRAALDAVKDSNTKSAMLDNMLASRMERLMSSRSIVLDEPVDQEGRKKKDKGMQQAMMMAGMAAAAVMGPMAMGMMTMMSAKALLLSKIALLLSGIVALKKLFQQQQGGGKEPESHPAQHWGRSMRPDDAHDMAYSGQKQQALTLGT